MRATTHTRRPRLAMVRQRLERWRAKRPHAHAALPPWVWVAAVALTRQHGLYRTARALRLDYGALKRRVEAPAPRVEPGPTFVELPRSGARPTVLSCAIELEGPAARLRVHVPEASLADLVTLSRRLAGLES